MSWKGSLHPTCGLRSRAGRPGRDRPSCRLMTEGRGGLPRKRLVAAVVAFVVFLGALAILWSAFRAASRVPPSPTESTDAKPGPRRNGELIQFEDVAGSSALDLAAQDPGTGQLRLFADTSAVIDCYVAEPCHTYPGRAAWSADGRWVAFDVYLPLGAIRDPAVLRPGVRGLWVVGAGGEPRQVAGPAPHARRSGHTGVGVGTGRRRGRLRPRHSSEGELFVFDPSDGTRRSLGRVDGQISALSWTPDGNRIALAAGGALYLVDLGSGERSRIATYQGIAGAGFSTGWPAGIKWSPDGTKIALVTHHRPGPHVDIRVGCAGPGRRGLAALRPPGPRGRPVPRRSPEVRWSPDGTQIAYTITVPYREKSRHGNSGQIWTVASDGSNPTMVFDPGCCLAFSLRPTWSPDGSRLAFTVGRTGGRPIAGARCRHGRDRRATAHRRARRSGAGVVGRSRQKLGHPVN